MAQDATSAPVNLDAEHISATSLIPVCVDVKEISKNVVKMRTDLLHAVFVVQEAYDYSVFCVLI
jgi:hypothetical protein